MYLNQYLLKAKKPKKAIGIKIFLNKIKMWKNVKQ
jgi:hypothetical protein